jgi:hypothetical protein
MSFGNTSQPVEAEACSRLLQGGLSPSMTAGLLMWATTILAQLQLPHPTVAEILSITKTRPSQAYARRTLIRCLVADLDRPLGRPRILTPAVPLTDITHHMLDFVLDHPGAVSRIGKRRRYSPGVRRFLLNLREQFPDLDLATFARAVHLSPERIRAWQRRRDIGKQDICPNEPSPPASAQSRSGPVAEVLRAYVSWSGSLTGFCKHLQHDLGIPWQRGAVSRLLEEHGLRAPAARNRPMAGSAAGDFQTFFPGAQWVADGSELTVRINGEPHRFNLELVVDTHSSAIVGAAIRDHEDGQAVVDAFRDAVTTTSTHPLSLLLDQRPCNFTAEVASGIGRTARIYAGRGRPQSKGHVEGAFGLFAQTRPRLEINAGDQRELARDVLRLVVQCWARTLNHRPRRRHGGRSRVALWQAAAAPHSDQVHAATMAIGERMERQGRRRAGRRRSRSRGGHDFVAQQLAQMGIEDRDGLVLRAVCDHPFEAVLAGLATFQGKYAAGTLPEDADGRYLIGVVRRLTEQDEGVHIAEALWRTRSTARSHLLRWLVEERYGTAPAQVLVDTPEGIVDQMVDRAVAAATRVERRLWLAALAEHIHGQSEATQGLYRRATCRIHTSPELSYSEQLACVRFLAAESIPMA